MKYLKIYEEYKYSDIKIGNYVVLNIKKNDIWNGSSDAKKNKIVEFTNNTIGEIVDINKGYYELEIEVKYTNIPFDIKFYFDKDNSIIVGTKEILDLSEEKQDLIDRYKLRQNVNKFNI